MPTLYMSTSKTNKENLAYVIGIALGDGNLSNPNGRATRLRITCDTKYDNLIKRMILAIQKLLPKNKVSIVKKEDRCIDISCYSNQWEHYLGWKAKNGSKEKQEVSIPKWIKNNKKYSAPCLRGLFETDGSVYFDRIYKMANFTTIIPTLAKDVMELILNLGFKPNMQIFKTQNGKLKHTIRISKNTDKFIRLLKINKN